MGKSYEDMTVTELKERLRNKNHLVSGNKKDLIARLRGSSKSGERVPANVIDKELYIKARNKVKKRVKVWPSAYASGQVVSEYRRSGGRYHGKKESTPLDRWYKEKWVNVCGKTPLTQCGRAQSKISDYPYCRPSVRVNSLTPMTVSEIKKKYGKQKLVDLCKKKRAEALPQKGLAQRIRPKETRKTT